METVTVAAIQPPAPQEPADATSSAARGLELLEKAIAEGAKIICLPEYFGLFGFPASLWQEQIKDNELYRKLLNLAEERGVTILYPTVKLAEGMLFNTTWVLGSQGLVGKYRKVHLPQSEREAGLSPGAEYPIFSVFGLKFGLMTCYDAYFPESARILALRGAQAIFFPSLQRATTEDVIRIQLQSRALDNCLYIIRSSYGYPRDLPWEPGMMVGMTAIANPEGKLVIDLGHDEGLLVYKLQLNTRPRYRSHGGELGSPREFLFSDRRPETYELLSQKQE